jgi:hypothetical protein
MHENTPTRLSHLALLLASLTRLSHSPLSLASLTRLSHSPLSLASLTRLSHPPLSPGSLTNLNSPCGECRLVVLVVRRAECKTLDRYQCVMNSVEWLEAAAGRAVCRLGKWWQGSAAPVDRQPLVFPTAITWPQIHMRSNANSSLAVGPGFGHRAAQYGKLISSLPIPRTRTYLFQVKASGLSMPLTTNTSLVFLGGFLRRLI